MSSNEYRYMMQGLVKLLRPETYVEIGANNGSTFNLITGAGKNIIKRAVAVDINPSPLCHIKKNRGDMKIEIHVGSSAQFATRWNDPIDMLFIDGDHHEDSVLEDFDNLSPYITDKGLIFLHDTCPYRPEQAVEGRCQTAWKAARKIHKHEVYKDFEIVTFPGIDPKGSMNGLSIIRRAKRHLLWNI